MGLFSEIFFLLFVTVPNDTKTDFNQSTVKAKTKYFVPAMHYKKTKHLVTLIIYHIKKPSLHLVFITLHQPKLMAVNNNSNFDLTLISPFSYEIILNEFPLNLLYHMLQTKHNVMHTYQKLMKLL